MFRAARGERPTEPDFTITRGYTQELWDMGMLCWDTDPVKRPTVDDVLNTLEIAAGRWRPKHDELQPLSPHDGRGTTASKREGSGHIPRAVTRDRGSRSTPPDAQHQNVQDTRTSPDTAVDQILVKAKSPLKENEVSGVVEVLERVCMKHLGIYHRSV